MAESTCFMQPFSYASGFNNEPNKGNSLNALGESVSFGRFVSETLSWEKWSAFSQNRYVEEAERYAQPGSVAQKKAFFDAHYKRIAEAKKAAALLEQENAASSTIDQETRVSDSTPLVVDEKPEAVNESISNAKQAGFENETFELADSATQSKISTDLSTENEVLNNLNVCSEMEKPLLTHERKPISSSSKSSVDYRKALKVSPSPGKNRAPLHLRRENTVTPTTRISTIESTEQKKSNPKSLRMLMNSASGREHDKFTTPSVKRFECFRMAATSYRTKDCSTPLKTPTTVALNSVQKHDATPCSETRRAKTPLHPSASGSKTAGPKWHALSSAYTKSMSACRKKLQSSGLSSPFILRTEERAARRKQKLEEKFNAKEAEKVQLQTKFKEKAETEVRKLRQTLCFKARPLPNFYKEKEIPENQIKNPENQIENKIKKTHQARPETPKLARSSSKSTTQIKASAKSPVSFSKKKFSKNLLKKNGQSQTPDLENKTPNIQL